MKKNKCENEGNVKVYLCDFDMTKLVREIHINPFAKEGQENVTIFLKGNVSTRINENGSITIRNEINGWD